MGQAYFRRRAMSVISCTAKSCLRPCGNSRAPDSATFGQDDNALLLVDESGARELPHGRKQDLAVQLITDIARRLK